MAALSFPYGRDSSFLSRSASVVCASAEWRRSFLFAREPYRFLYYFTRWHLSCPISPRAAHFSLIDLIRLYCICCKEATSAASRKLSFKKTPTSAERERERHVWWKGLTQIKLEPKRNTDAHFCTRLPLKMITLFNLFCKRATNLDWAGIWNTNFWSFSDWTSVSAAIARLRSAISAQNWMYKKNQSANGQWHFDG